MGPALLLTGRPGVGKTTVIRAVLQRLGDQAGGFYTEEIREGGQRTGFRLVGLPEGILPATVLADVNTHGRYRVGRYRVHLDNLERVGVGALGRAIRDSGISVVIVDEIGKMELISPRFRQSVLEALDGPKPVVATVMAGPEAWVDAIRSRPDVAQIRVTRGNRQSLHEQVIAWLQGATGGQRPPVEP